MTLPGFYLTEEELTLNIPKESDLIVGLIGPATKGLTDVLLDSRSEPELVNQFGPPVDHHYGVRAGIRFQREGNQLKYARVAGTLLSYASRDFYSGSTRIITVTAASPGTWANGDVTIGITQISATVYNLQVYYKGNAVEGELWKNLTNGSIETTINGNSVYITVAVDAGAGTAAPDATTDAVTGAMVPVVLSGADDGAFASTRSEDSSTGGIAGKRFYGMMDANPALRTWYNVHTITAADAGLTTYRGTLGMPVQPGSFYIRIETAAAVFAELTDDEDGVLVNGMANSGVGQLRDVTNTHIGYINYRTGAWGIILVGGPVGFLTGTIDVICVRGRSEAVGSALTGVGAYTGALASPDVCPGSMSVARAQIHVPREDGISTDSGIAAAQHDSADANCQPMDGFILPSTVIVTAPTATGTQIVYDDGFGGWNTAAFGAGTPVVGTINYRTGVWDITFPIVVPANSPISAKYINIVTDMGSNALAGLTGVYVAADQVCTNATGGAPQIDSADANCTPLASVPVEPGSIRFVCSDVVGVPETVYDDGVGGLCSLRRGDSMAIDVVGTVDYATGAWDITFSGNVGAGATIDASYVPTAGSKNLRALRNHRLDTTDPAVGNEFLGLNYINYITGAFSMTINFAANQDVENNAAIYSVYQHGEQVGWGDGTTVTFAGDVADAPIRREANRMLAFQGGHQASPTAGVTQVTFATLGPPDYWNQNVGGGAGANPINFATGVIGMQWSAAPYNAEAVFVVAEEVVGHVTCIWTGDIGNERATIADGLYCDLRTSPSDATKLRFRVMFNDGGGAVAVETFDLLVNFADLLAKVNATDGTGSNLVNIEDTGAGTEPDTGATQDLGMAGAFTCADIIGAKVGATYTGLQLFSNEDTVAVDVVSVPGQWHRQVQDAGIILCGNTHRRAHWLYSQPDFTPPDLMDDALPGIRSVDPAQDSTDFVDGHYNAAVVGGVAVPNAWVPYPPLSTVNSSYASTHAFFINYYDQYEKKDVWEPPEGDFSQLLAKIDRDQERWYPPAGTKRTLFQDVNTVRYSPDREDREKMYEFDGVTQHVVNPIRYKDGTGIFPDGQRTMLRGAVALALDRINVRLLMNKLGNLLEIANMRYEYDLNDPILWRQVEATGRLIIKPMIAKRGLYDGYLICDSTTNTPDVIDQYKCVARLMIQPTKAAEAIEYNVIIVPTGVSFEEVLAV